MFRTAAPTLHVPDHLARMVAWARGVPVTPAVARRVLPLIDATSLNDDDDDWSIEAFCRHVLAAPVRPAAVVVEPRFVRLARRTVDGSGVRVATVVNFPDGEANAMAAREETRAAVGDGADEIDAVFPYRAFLEGDRAAGAAVVAACRAECREGVPLKIILETGAFRDADRLAEAGRLALQEGADFLKTGTGKTRFGATPEAAAVLLQAVRSHRLYGGRRGGLKASGGIRTLAQATPYVALAEAVMGRGWATPHTVRIGSSALLDDAVAALAGGAGR
jgi:deoxyribose-phosphate aldolase